MQIQCRYKKCLFIPKLFPMVKKQNGWRPQYSFNIYAETTVWCEQVLQKLVQQVDSHSQHYII